MSRHRRKLQLPVVFLSAAAIALFIALPSPAAADSGQAPAVQGPVAPTLAVPGVFSLNLGQGFSNTPEGLTLQSAQIAIPAVAAVATVDGLTLDQNFRVKDWNTFTVSQNSPRETDTYSISNATLAVSGPSSGYSTAAYANFNLHGNDKIKVNGTFGVAYDGLARTFGIGARNADVALQAGPLNVTLTGVNSLPGGMTVDNVAVSGAGTGATVAVSGFQTGAAGVDWDTLDVSAGPLAFGNALVVSPAEVHIGGSATGYARTAVVGLALKAGDVAQVQGDVVTMTDPASGARQFAVQNGSAQVALRGFSLGFDGVSTNPAGTSIDSVKLQADQVGFTAEVNGLTVDPNGQGGFDTATIRYQPQGANAAAGSGFVTQINRTDAGYVVTTTTVVPAARR